MAGFAFSHALERGRSLFAGKAAGASQEDTFAQLMIQAFGPALFDFMVRPYVEKVWKNARRANSRGRRARARFGGRA